MRFLAMTLLWMFPLVGSLVSCGDGRREQEEEIEKMEEALDPKGPAEKPL